MKQRGFAFLPFLLGNWQMIAIGLLAAGVFGYYAHCQHIKNAYSAQTAAMEAQLEKNRQEKIARDKITTQQEADHAKRYADISAKYAAARKRLSAHGGQAQPLSDAAQSLNCPDRQADLARGLERLESGILALLERGDTAIERTITCKAWLDAQIKVSTDAP